MPNTQKVIYLFCTEHCAPCDGLHDILEAAIDKYDGVHIEKIMADDDGRGSALATDLKIRSTPTVIFAEWVVGRKQGEYYTEKVRRLML